MVSIVSGPAWFVALGVVIELLSTLAVGLVAATLFRYYVIARDRKFLHLGLGFAMLCLSFLGRGLLTLGLFMKPYGLLEGGVVAFQAYPGLLRSWVLLLGILGIEFLLLFGFFIIFSAYHDVSKTEHGLVAFLLLLLLWFAAEAYFVFHLIGLVLVLLVTTALIARYFMNRRKTTLFLASTFGVLVLSHLLFLFVPLSPLFYVAAAVVELVGFFLLLGVYVYLMSHGKKIKT